MTYVFFFKNKVVFSESNKREKKLPTPRLSTNLRMAILCFVLPTLGVRKNFFYTLSNFVFLIFIISIYNDRPYANKNRKKDPLSIYYGSNS